MKENQNILLNFERDIKTSSVEWLFYPYIPYGRITLLQGDPGCGKTFAMSNIIAKLSRGENLNIPDEKTSEVISIYQTGEDGLGDTIKPRLEMFNADCSNIYSIDEMDEALNMQDERIEQAIQLTGAKVLILDPLQAYIGSQIDMHRANEVRPVLKQLGTIAAKYNVAVILVGHMNKGQSKALYRSIGSIDIVGYSRSVLTVSRLKDNEDIRIMLHTKSSLAPAGMPLAFSLTEKEGFKWLGEYEISEDELLYGGKGNSKLDQAIELINQLITNEPVASTYITEEAKKKNIGQTTLKAAKEAIGIKSIRQNNSWYWWK